MAIGLLAMAQKEGISYQAVIINPDEQQLPGIDAPGTVLAETEVQLRFSILDETNNVEYQEEIQTTTDAYGMVNVLIGTGIPVGDAGFTQIKWGGAFKSLYVELDLQRGGGYTYLGVQGLTYIPYAQHRDINASGDLTVDGNTTFNGDLVIEGLTVFNDDIEVLGDLNIGDDLEVADRLTVLGRTELRDQVTVDGDAILNQNLQLTNGNTTLNGLLDVSGVTTLGNDLEVEGLGRFASNVVVEGAQTVGGNQIIGGGQTIINNVIVGGQIEIDERLIVGGDSILNNDLDVTNGNTTLNGLLDVQSDTTIGGDVFISGVTTIDNALNVSGNTDIDGTLNVGLKATMESALEVFGQTTINNSFKVEGANLAQFGNDIVVLGNSNLEGPLNVLNTSSTDLSGTLHVVKTAQFDDDVVIDGMLTVNNNFTMTNMSVSGVGTLAGNHVALFESTAASGGDGVAIRIGEGTLNSTNQFVTFLGAENHVAGRISSFDLTDELPEQSGLDTENLNQGVVYGSRGADYAEWLEKEDPSLDFKVGEVVGVHGGKISRITAGADHVLTISMAPIVLGNMPDADRKQDFEKVGFLGQVPALVSGKVQVGDYILASGKNDGLAVAVAADLINLDNMDRIIGKAWSASSQSNPKLINVSVGLKTGEWVQLIKSQDQRLKNMEDRLNELNLIQQRLEKLELKMDSTDTN